MSYLVGAGLTLVVLLGCLPLLNHSGETPPDPPPSPHNPGRIVRPFFGNSWSGIRRPMISWRAIRERTTCRWT